jgi:predicted alpha/beta superfamily hydrolase
MTGPVKGLSMRRNPAALGLLCAALAINSAVAAQPAAGPPAQIAASTQFDVHSPVNGLAYRVKVAIPAGTPPSGGFPVLYVLDGDAFFGTFTEAVRQRAGARESQAAVVVGVTYPDEKTAELRRLFDLSPSAPSADEAASLAEAPPGASYGGAEAFFDLIQQQVRPRVAQIAPVDARRSTLFGWSLGGLFVVQTLFVHPGAFQSYVALSPSIWWNDKAVLKGEAGLEGRIAARTVAPRLLLGVGGLEQSVPKGPLPFGYSRDKIEMVLAYARMVDNVRDLGARLTAVHGAPGYDVETHVFEGQSHNSEPWAAVDPTIDFALPPGLSPSR